MQSTGVFGALNSGMSGVKKKTFGASPNPLKNVARSSAPRPVPSVKVPAGPGKIGGLSGLPGESTGPLGKAPVNAFAGMQPMLKQALGAGANAQSPVGDRLNKLPRRRRAV